MTHQEHNLARLEAAEGLRPHPDTPTGEAEWTVDYVRNLELNYGWEGVAHNHNAAIAKEREDHTARINSVTDFYSRQLAAERENGLNAVAGLERNHAHEIWKLEQQLAAERERYDFKANLTEEIVRLNQQLAAEREKRIQLEDDVAKRGFAIDGLRSQLAAAVEALEKLHQLAHDKRQIKLHGGFPLEALRIIDAAVKEGKK